MPNILEVKNLVKNYGDFQAVKGVSFEIAEGEIFSLLGPNGAGKTTTISMLSTLYAPTSGDATIGGHSISKDPMGVRNIIGVVPQDLALYEDLTAKENLIFWGQMYGLSGKPLASRVDDSAGHFLSPRVALNWRFAPTQSLRLVSSKAYRTPDLQEEKAYWQFQATTEDRSLSQYDGSHYYLAKALTGYECIKSRSFPTYNYVVCNDKAPIFNSQLGINCHSA